MEKLFKKHKDWLNIVKSFGCTNHLVEDIVQDMYLKIGVLINKGLDISYNDDDINYYYIYMTLKSIFYNKVKKDKRAVLVPLDNDIDNEIELIAKLDDCGDIENLYNEVLNELDTMRWYDKKVWDLVQDIPITQLSRETEISYRSLYNTKRKVEKILRDKVNSNGIR